VLAAADSYITWNREEAVKLRTSDTGPQSQAPVSVVTAFQQTLARFPDHAALGMYAVASKTDVSPSKVVSISAFDCMERFVLEVSVSKRVEA